MITFDDVRAALHLPDFNPLLAQLKMAPSPNGQQRREASGAPPPATPPRKAGVLVPIYPDTDGLRLIMTRRTETVRGHSGQISFPGGQHDPQDSSFADTALRETCEELGLCGGITLIGQLSRVYIPPTHYDVFPTVGVLAAPPVLHPNPDEVAEVLTFRLDDLVDERNKRVEYREMQGFRVKIPYYDVQGHHVWGATAAMLSELEHRLRAVLGWS